MELMGTTALPCPTQQSQLSSHCQLSLCACHLLTRALLIHMLLYGWALSCHIFSAP